MILLAFLIATLTAVGLWVTPALAETYRWTDESGGVHYTDELSSIPERYRSKAQRIGATPAPPEPPPSRSP